MTCDYYKYLHQEKKDRKLVSKLLDRELEFQEKVHHESYGVLVLCKDQAQHSLTHQQLDALKACGFKDWRRCWICQKYDDPSNLYIRNGRI